MGGDEFTAVMGDPVPDMEQNDAEDVDLNGDPTVLYSFTVVRTCLALFGLLANTVTGVVLTNKKLWNPTSMLLLSLVAYDALFLLASIPPCLMQISDVSQNAETYMILLGICYPFRYMAQTGSIYTTVTVTVERFLIVLRPLKARVFCTFRKTRKAILGIFLFSVMFNIPRCFFYKLLSSGPYLPHDVNSTDYYKIYHSHLSNQSATNLTTPHVFAAGAYAVNHSSEPVIIMDEDTQYYMWLYLKVYELYVSSVLFYLLPYTLIPILNMQLLLAIKKRRKETRRISVKNEHRLNFSKPTDLEDGLTLIVLGITVCFFICCLIPAVYNVTQIAEVPTEFYYYLLIASDTMLCINASTDFFFYCLLGRKFRNIFLRLFCPKWYFKGSENLTGSYYKASHKASETLSCSVQL